MTPAELMTMDAGLVRAHSAGELLMPGEPGWDAARRTFNLAVDQQPAAIALPETDDDVSLAVRFAAGYGLRVAAQRTGHNAVPLGPLDGTLLVRTDRLQGVEIDTVARRARVRGGAKWEDVVPRASALGLAALHGSTLDVSVAGYSLGGGVGWYARKHGLAANSVTAIEVVTADGELRRVDHENEPELFWALRGGGGNFGVVTSLEFDLYPVDEVYAGILFFPFERAGEVLHAWREWVADVPDEVTSVGRLLQFPPLPQLPEPLRGNAFAVVEAVYTGREADGADLLAPIRDLGATIDTFAMVPPVALSGLHMDPPDPLPYTSDHLLLDDMPAKAIDAFVEAAGPASGSPLVSVELRHTGGALSRSTPRHGALATLPGSFAYFGVGAARDEPMKDAMDGQLETVRGALAPWDAGLYANFTEEAVDARRFYGEDTLRRLQAVKADVDPDGLFRANHAIDGA
jgi:FAD/FMN-containing dehydrogenase